MVEYLYSVRTSRDNFTRRPALLDRSIHTRTELNERSRIIHYASPDVRVKKIPENVYCTHHKDKCSFQKCIHHTYNNMFDRVDFERQNFGK